MKFLTIEAKEGEALKLRDVLAEMNISDLVTNITAGYWIGGFHSAAMAYSVQLAIDLQAGSQVSGLKFEIN